MTDERIDIDKNMWDQSKFLGRFQYFAWMSNPMNGLVGNQTLLDAKKLLQEYREGKEPPGTTEAQVVRAMQLYKSAFHPDSGELQNVFGRMSFQVPGGMLITGAMLQFYKTTPQVVFWQWFNQSFNALVNYTNRNASVPTDFKQMGLAYFSATSAALGTALGLKTLLAKSSSPLLQRLVPCVAVAASNCVNIPLMRQVELREGMTITDDLGETACLSKTCAADGIGKVVASRVAIAGPGMLALPIIMQRMERMAWFKARPFIHAPFQVLGVGCFLMLMVPTGCSIWPQNVEISSEKLRSIDPDAYSQLLSKYGDKIPPNLYYNKGL